MGTDCKIAADVKRKQADGELLDSADLFSAGTMITAPEAWNRVWTSNSDDYRTR